MNSPVDPLQHALREKASPAELARTMEELLGQAAATIRSGSPKALQALARACSELAHTLRPAADDEAAWHRWHAAQCMAIAKLSRMTLLERMPFEVTATLGERKNLLPILRMLAGRELNLSTIGRELDLDASQLTREVDLLVRLRLVESFRGGRQRWIRLTALGRKAVEESGVPALPPEAASGTMTRVAMIGGRDGSSRLRDILNEDGRITVVDATAPPESVSGALIVIAGGIAGAAGVMKEWTGRPGKPAVLFIDEAGADAEERIFNAIDVVRKLTPDAVPLQAPYESFGRMTGVIDLVQQTIVSHRNVSPWRPEVDWDHDGATKLLEILTESVAERDDVLFEKLLLQEPLAPSDLEPVLHRAIADGRIVPILCGSSETRLGTAPLIDFLLKTFLPMPADSAVTAASTVVSLPAFVMQVSTPSGELRARLEDALRAISEETPDLDIEHDPAGRWTSIGANHPRTLALVGEQLDSKGHITVNYRQTIRRAAEGHGRVAKNGEFADLSLRVEPVTHDGDVEIGGAPEGVPSLFLPAIRQGIRAGLARRGDEAPVARIRVTLLAGRYHDLDSTEPAFRRAAFDAVRSAVQRGDPYLLEPMLEVELTAPDGASVRQQVAASKLEQLETRESGLSVSVIGYEAATRSIGVAAEAVAAH